MKKLTQVTKTFLERLDRRHVQLVLLIVSLSLFVLGAGAPGAGGGIGGW